MSESVTPAPAAGELSASAPVEAEVQPAPSPTDALVDAWFVERFHNVAGLSVEFFNRFSAARDDLKARLNASQK